MTHAPLHDDGWASRLHPDPWLLFREPLLSAFQKYDDMIMKRFNLKDERAKLVRLLLEDKEWVSDILSIVSLVLTQSQRDEAIEYFSFCIGLTVPWNNTVCSLFIDALWYQYELCKNPDLGVQAALFAVLAEAREIAVGHKVRITYIRLSILVS